MLSREELLTLLLSVDENITPIRVQKISYFLYAYWYSYRNQKSDKSMSDFADLNFEAWSYGPVDKKLYCMYRDQKEKYAKGKINILSKEVISYFNFIYNQFLEYPDFALVHISHKDRAWFNNYNERDIYHEKEISKEDIIEEYKNKKIALSVMHE